MTSSRFLKPENDALLSVEPLFSLLQACLFLCETGICSEEIPVCGKPSLPLFLIWIRVSILDEHTVHETLKLALWSGVKSYFILKTSSSFKLNLNCVLLGVGFGSTLRLLVNLDGKIEMACYLHTRKKENIYIFIHTHTHTDTRTLPHTICDPNCLHTFRCHAVE